MKTYRRIPVLACLLLLAGCVVPTTDIRLTGDPARLLEAGRQNASPLWKIPLGPVIVEEMHPIASDKLLIGLRKFDLKLSNLDYLLIDTKAGKELWRYRRDKTDGEYRLLHGSENIVLLRVVQPSGESAAVAIDTRSGVRKWEREWSGPVHFLPHAETGMVLVLGSGKKGSLTALGLTTGTELWEKAVPGQGESLVEKIGGAILLLADRIERIDPGSGKTAWRRDDLRAGEGGAFPLLAGTRLFLLDRQKRLLQIDFATGKTIARSDIDPELTVTNVCLSGQRVYLLGVKTERDPFLQKPYIIAAYDAGSGARCWVYKGELPAISNFLEADGRLYFGTANALVCLDPKNGRSCFHTTLTNLKRPYPVRLKLFGDTIAYVGELVIAGLDPRTGRVRYKYGMTPLFQEMSLTGVDAAIERLEKKIALGKASREKRQFNRTTYHLTQARQYKQLADNYEKRLRTGFSTNPELDSLNAALNRDMSRQASFQALQSSIDELGEAFVRLMEEMADAGTLGRLKIIQGTVLGAYGAAEEGEYAYRPVDASSLTCLKIIHLPTGRQSTIALSPLYGEYGLWNLVDLEKGVVFHHGIGLNPADHRLSEPFFNYQMARVRMLESYLIAQPVEIPE